MVVRPEDVERLTAKDEKEVKRLEEMIDEALMKGDTTSGITFGASCIPNRKVRDAIIGMYQGAGWHVTYEDDQRDGSYLRFSKSMTRQYYER